MGHFNDDARRHDWTFEYLAAKVAEAALQQRDYRLSRVTAWEKAKEDLMAEIRDSGLEITESIADQMSSASYQISTRSHSGPRINVRADLQEKLMECHGKISEHKAAATEYDSWYQVLKMHPEKQLELSQADWIYFFGFLGKK